MRITAQAKQATRERIVAAAAELFRRQGFEATTTRDIAQAAGTATGTLFNYFATKEAILASLAAEALAKVHNERVRQASEESLEEGLFALVAAELRQLKPLRKFLKPLLETSLSPLAAADRSTAGERVRIEHLELVAEIVRRHGMGELSPTAFHLYWSLYLGVLSFWSADTSPKQEDTLALLDESLAMFSAWLRQTVKPVED
jgi:AcrR family transcriptional regulator